MAIYDVTVPISPHLTIYPDDPPTEMRRVFNMEEGALANVSHLQWGTHSGTHVDAILSLTSNGTKVNRLPLEYLVGLAWVADCRGVTAVTAEVLDQANIPQETTRLLLVTNNSDLWNNPYHPFESNFVDIDISGATWIVEQGIKLLGIDYGAVDNLADQGAPAHNTLLPNEVVCIKNLDLRQVPPNCNYELVCLPLKIETIDTVPSRVILRS